MAAKPDYRRILESTLGVPFTENNSIEVLKNGNEIFGAMLDAIKKTKKKIDFLTFVYWAGHIPDRFAKELAKKAEKGLQVRVLLDCYGAAYMPAKLYTMMEDRGVQIEWFRPLSRLKIWKAGSRTHRKILVCDDEIGFTGGVGIADEWDGDARNPNEYRDNHFKITGPAVRGLQASFLENWTEAASILPIEECQINNHPDSLPAVTKVVTGEPNAVRVGSEPAGVPMQIISGESSVRWSDTIMIFQSLIQMAQESIYISTAYFNPGPILIQLLTEAVERGVTVHILMPGKYNDMRIAKVAGDDSFEPLLQGGVELSYYQKTMYHCKAIVVDEKVSCIGSANFNHRSFMMDDEISLLAIDETLAQTLTDYFKEDLNDSEKVDETRWERRSYWRRMKEKMTYLLQNHI